MWFPEFNAQLFCFDSCIGLTEDPPDETKRSGGKKAKEEPKRKGRPSDRRKKIEEEEEEVEGTDIHFPGMVTIKL